MIKYIILIFYIFVCCACSVKEIQQCLWNQKYSFCNKKDLAYIPSNNENDKFVCIGFNGTRIYFKTEQIERLCK